MSGIHKIWFLLLIVVYPIKGSSQEKEAEFEMVIERLITQDSIQKAEELVIEKIAHAKPQEDYETLSRLVYWLGKIEITTNSEKLFPQATKLFQEITRASSASSVLFHAHLGISKLYNEKGNAGKAYEVASTAKKIALSLNDTESEADIFFYLGEYGLRSGNINTFEENMRKAHAVLKANVGQEFKLSPRILNYMGALMYLTSKPDSALYFYNKALTKIDVMEKNSGNQLYFPAAIKANIVLLKQAQNQYDEALELAKECVFLNNRFLKSEKKHPLRYRSQRNLSLAYRNLVSLYEQVGDYEKANRIAELAYNHAKANFEPQLLENFSAVTLLAEAKIANKDFDRAIEICGEAETSLALMQGENPLLKANLYTILGGAFYGKKNYSEAMKYYELGNEFHGMAQEGTYSSDRLFAMMNLALCYAHLEKNEKANSILEDAFAATGENGRLKNSVVIAQARVANILRNYEHLQSSTNKFLKEDLDVNNPATNAYRAEMIAMNAKAIYHLNTTNDVESLKKIAVSLQEAVQILEDRKSSIFTQNNISELIQDHEQVFDFGKRINLELYNRTRSPSDLKNVLSFHESSIYSRIRSRLDLKENGSTFKLAEETALREKELKQKVNSEIEDATTYLKNVDEWNLFLDSLKVSNPKYYKMRYATIAVPLSDLKKQIPKNTTLVRYFFIDDTLHAYVVNSSLEKLIPLKSNDIEFHIRKLSDYQTDVSNLSNSANKLYEQLWKPIASSISTEKVIIFPDKELFNLNFELLTQENITSFEELSQKSLLSKFSISYNYSLLLLDKKRKTIDYNEDFIAFAPEFNKKMKDDYQIAISDSIDLDKTYLRLLPQPFSSELVNKFTKRFRGQSFLNEKASKQLFSKTAREHKIIHIGTHAESNNISPELSRLVFAKNVSDSLNLNDNYLYTYEIYNQDLSSNLAILTACETGKPTYQPGEGMISLAHAFNYAGSESILTSLWQIDERSSTQILDYFYTYLEQGLPKDVALRQAKLDYLATAKGRTLHPQYWAGLVLMGDTSPIELSGSNLWHWISIGLALIVLLVFVLFKRKSLH
ncbi:CHAT domain-containing protein [Maribacter halichondriae]|uniref:CHAT domain-containing protein n=1 Tax=Maribacter halichondriae TaxID=2980554 RepID=UPI0023599AA3|nr:CHAT domain-containing protein [Maribacter sp. Hal144]